MMIGAVVQIGLDCVTIEQRSCADGSVCGLLVIPFHRITYLDLRPIADQVNEDGVMIFGMVRCRACAETWEAEWPDSADVTLLECPVCGIQDSELIDLEG